VKLIEAARVVRSKNAGPLKVTVDLMFDDRAGYERARQSPALSAANLARLYGLDEAQVEVLPYPPALAIKLGVSRQVLNNWLADRKQGAPDAETTLELLKMFWKPASK